MGFLAPALLVGLAPELLNLQLLALHPRSRRLGRGRSRTPSLICTERLRERGSKARRCMNRSSLIETPKAGVHAPPTLPVQ
jgi:hypothetical protein